MTPDMGGIVGRVRGLNVAGAPENREDEQFHIAPYGDDYHSQGLPELAEIVRLGESWQLLTAAFTPLAALPTTVAIARLWNGEPGNGKIYVIDSVAVFKPIIDVTTQDAITIFAQNVKAPVAAPTDSGIAKISLSGKQNYSGRARHDTNVASSAVAGQWSIIGNLGQHAPAIAGSAWECVDVPLKGLFVVPPGGAFCLHCARVTATANSLRAAIRWHEVQIPYVT